MEDPCLAVSTTNLAEMFMEILVESQEIPDKVIAGSHYIPQAFSVFWRHFQNDNHFLNFGSDFLEIIVIHSSGRRNEKRDEGRTGR